MLRFLLTATRLAANKTAVVGRLFLGLVIKVSVITKQRTSSMPKAWTGLTCEGIVVTPRFP